jgi:tRNA A37 methylthiotransferase MiaB
MRICRGRTTRTPDLVPPQGIKLTPRHYAYLKISEGCNHAAASASSRRCAAIW